MEVINIKKFDQFDLRFVERENKIWYIAKDVIIMLYNFNINNKEKIKEKIKIKLAYLRGNNLNHCINKCKILIDNGVRRDVSIINNFGLLEWISSVKTGNSLLLRGWFCNIAEENMDRMLSDARIHLESQVRLLKEKDTVIADLRDTIIETKDEVKYKTNEILKKEFRIRQQEEALVEKQRLMDLQVAENVNLRAMLDDFLKEKPDEPEPEPSHNSSSSSSKPVTQQFQKGPCVAILTSKKDKRDHFTAYKVVIEEKDINESLREMQESIQQTGRVIMIGMLIYTNLNTARKINDELFKKEYYLFDGNKNLDGWFKSEGWLQSELSRDELFGAIGEYGEVTDGSVKNALIKGEIRGFYTFERDLQEYNGAVLFIDKFLPTIVEPKLPAPALPPALLLLPPKTGPRIKYLWTKS